MERVGGSLMTILIPNLVARKTFAYYLNSHHGDGIISICCKVMPGDNARLAAAHPRRFYLPAYLASKGWVALRLDVPELDWDEAAELLSDSHRRIAPKRLGGH